jgi:hypothetical protein
LPDQIQVLQARATANDADANPLPGALIYVYQTGTTTPVTTYSDIALSTPHANPIEADAAGRFGPIFYGGSLQLKIVIKTAAGATVDTIDPTPKWSATTITAATVSYVPRASNAGTDVQVAINTISDAYAAFIASLATTPLAITSVRFDDGTAAAPSIVFADDLDTGIYSPAANQIGLTTGGTVRATLSTADLTMGSGIEILGDYGTASLPGYAFAGDPNTGMYRAASDQIGFSVGGANAVTVSASGVIMASGVQVEADDGTALLPGLSFASDTNTGFYRPAANSIGVIVAGTEYSRIVSTGSHRFGDLTTDNVGTSGTAGLSLSPVGNLQIARNNSVFTGNRTDGDGTLCIFRRLGAQVGSIVVSAGATAYNTSSDYRLKNEIGAPAGYDVRDRIAALDERLTWFEWKENPTQGPQFGALAHVLAEAAPYAVTGAKDAMDPETGDIAPQGVDWSKLVPEMIAALADAHRRIAVLEAG